MQSFAYLEESKDILSKLILCYLILYFNTSLKKDTHSFIFLIKQEENIECLVYAKYFGGHWENQDKSISL